MKKSALLKELNTAAAKNDVDRIKIIHAKKQIDLHACGKTTQKTPLHWAGEHNSTEAADYLIKHAEKDVINQKDVTGKTPLNLCVQSRRGPIASKLRTITYLLEKGANPLIPDKASITPLMAMAALRDCKEVGEDPKLTQSVQEIIITMKQYISTRAAQNNQTARIAKDGSVTFVNNCKPLSAASVGATITATKPKVISDKNETLVSFGK